MKQPTSLFNKAVFKSDLKRFWWVSALHTLLIFVSCLLPLYIAYAGIERPALLRTPNEYYGSDLLGYSIFPYLMLFVVTVGLSVLLFSYLNSKSAVATMHAVPVKRKTLFFTHSVFGIVSLVVPVLVNAVILMIMRTDPYISQVVTINHIFWWGFSQIAYAIVGFSFATLVGTLAANSVAHIMFTYIFAVLPLAVEIAVKGLMNLHLHGYYIESDVFSVTTSYLYFGMTKMGTVLYPLIYIGYGIVLLGLSLFAYKLRHLENTSEVVAFPKLKPLFIYGVAICMGVCGYFYLNAIFDAESLLWILPFGILGLVIANMLTKKAITIKGVVKPVMALVITAIAFVYVFQFDLTGYEMRVPDIEKIESVSVTEMPVHNIFRERTIDGIKKIEKEVYVPELTDKKDIENVIALHEYKAENREDGRKMMDTIYITYKLKNGKMLKRQYLVNHKEEKDLLKPILETEQFKNYKFPITLNGTKNIHSVAINDERFGGEFARFLAEKDTDAENINKIITALSKDLENVRYDDFAYEESTLTTIDLEVEMPWYYKGTNEIVSTHDFGMYTEHYSYVIRPSYKNTIAVLTDLGLYNAIPKPEDYVKVTLRANDYTTTYIDDFYRVSVKENLPEEVVIEDPEVIQELYKYVTEVPKNHYDAVRSENGYISIEVRFEEANGYYFISDRTSFDENLPKVIKDIVK